MADNTDQCEVRSSIIMKIDGPDDNSNSTDNDADHDPAPESSSKPSNSWICGSSNSKLKLNNPFLTSTASSAFGNNCKGILKPCYLRPSQLLQPKQSAENEVLNTGPLAPSRLNPFKHLQKHEDEENVEVDKLDSEKSNNIPTKINTTETKAGEDSLRNSVPKHETNNKVQTTLVSEGATAPKRSTVTSNFVFGENVQARVVNENSDEINKPGYSGASSAPSSNGTSEMLFSSLLNKDMDNAAKESNIAVSLSESAKAYEESRSNKRKYEEVEVITGEEGETNVLQFSCKLFAFQTGIWQERGRGTLRLNDKDAIESRLVWRNIGSHRVMLNTSVWSGMTVERASPKSLRITAMDSTAQIKVFLIMASPKEIDQLQKALQLRVSNTNSKSNTTEGDQPSPKKPA